MQGDARMRHNCPERRLLYLDANSALTSLKRPTEEEQVPSNLPPSLHMRGAERSMSQSSSDQHLLLIQQTQVAPYVRLTSTRRASKRPAGDHFEPGRPPHATQMEAPKEVEGAFIRPCPSETVYFPPSATLTPLYASLLGVCIL